MIKKRILFKVSEFPLVSETFIVSQIVSAIKLDYDVKILVKNIRNKNSHISTELIEKYLLLDKIILEDYKIPKNKILRLLTWLKILIQNLKDLNYILKFYKEFTAFSLSYLFQWRFYEQFKNIDIFHIQYGTNKHPLDLLKKIDFLKGALIVSFHGHDAFFPINGIIANNGYYDNLFSKAKAIVANTPYLGNKIEGLGCELEVLKTIPIGVDTAFFYPLKNKKNDSENFKLISVGRLTAVKGHIYALKAVKMLHEGGHRVLLKIVGEGTERNNLLKFIEENKLEKVIKLVGAKSQFEIRELLWESDLFLFPSVTLENGRAETQGLSTIEAQACGVPVIVFDSGGVKYTLKNNVTGFMCKEFDYECMFKKIKHVMETPELFDNMKMKAVTFVAQNYAQNVIDKKWFELYNNAIKHGK